MSQPIRCQPLPFVQANGEAAAGAPSRTGPNTGPNSPECSDFNKLLNAELSEVTTEPEGDAEENSADAVATYGLALLLVQPGPPQPDNTLAIGTLKTPEHSVQGSAPLEAESAPPAATGASNQEQPAGNKTAPKAELPLIETLSPASAVISAPEQKVPTAPDRSRPAAEQISKSTAEPAKKSNGIVAAQPPLMLTTSQSVDESALSAERPLALAAFEASSFEQSVEIRPVQGKPAGAQKVSADDFGRVGNEMLPQPRFEALAGDIEVQPVRPVEPAPVLETIRTHIELLKTSSAEKLDVVLRPDSHTELHLQVEKINGVIQVQARCDRGDFSLLEAHWVTIQNTLATQGVRVDPLQQGAGAQFHQNGSQQFQNSSGQNSNQREERVPIFNEQDFSNREPARAKASRTYAARGWQSWA